MRLNQARFWPKKEAFLQKKVGSTEIILHFFSRFLVLWGFFPLQTIGWQPLTAIRPLQKKSCLKTYRRFFVRSGMCLNGVVKAVLAGRNDGCEGWTAVKRRPSLRARRFGTRNKNSAFGRPPPKAGQDEAKLTLSNLTGLRSIALNCA